MADRICTVENCDRRAEARGMCLMHYKRWRRLGTTALPDSDPFARIMSHVTKDSSGCWLWTLSLNTYGYAQTTYGGRRPMVHRLVYETLVGPIPDGLHLDHLCRVRHCVNPAHLEPVTPGENVRRGRLPQLMRERARARTHCKNGHEYTAENTTMVAKGPYKSRLCVTCYRAGWQK